MLQSRLVAQEFKHQWKSFSCLLDKQMHTEMEVMTLMQPKGKREKIHAYHHMYSY